MGRENAVKGVGGETRRPGRTRTFEATAYALRSATASGEEPQRGVVAAAPRAGVQGHHTNIYYFSIPVTRFIKIT
jgi:hypothetical protein